MKVTIKPHYKSTYPKSGVLIKSKSVHFWLEEINRMGLVIEETKTFPIPDIVANSVWGCILVANQPDLLLTSIYPMCQLVENKLFIPANSKLFPNLTPQELDQLVGKVPAVFHPDFGLVSLENEVNWQEILTFPAGNELEFRQPATGKNIPSGEIKSFKVQVANPEDVIKEMEQGTFPERERLIDKPLNWWEKIKLFLLKIIFNNKVENLKDKGKQGNQSAKQSAGFLDRFFSNNKFFRKLETSFEELQERNEKEIDKLISLLKDDPEKALKYAIPLAEGESRGNIGNSSFKMESRWGNFNLFGNGNRSAGGGNVAIGDNKFLTLRQQYQKTAKELAEKQEYKKAAFIYMKLLKEYYSAATVLEKGKFYGEAASIHLKYNQDKKKAAHCYEKGMMIEQAIALQKELGDHEKVGDLYSLLNNRDEANYFYDKVVVKLTDQRQYLKASGLLRDKMSLRDQSQKLLLKAWQEDADGYNCLNRYFSDFENEEDLAKEIRVIYNRDATDSNIHTFLNVVLKEYKRGRGTEAGARDIIYEILVNQAKNNPSLLSELKVLNENDQTIFKDILRYRHNQ